jgi:hypothetical protein
MGRTPEHGVESVVPVGDVVYAEFDYVTRLGAKLL